MLAKTLTFLGSIKKLHRAATVDKQSTGSARALGDSLYPFGDQSFPGFPGSFNQYAGQSPTPLAGGSTQPFAFAQAPCPSPSQHLKQPQVNNNSQINTYTSTNNFRSSYQYAVSCCHFYPSMPTFVPTSDAASADLFSGISYTAGYQTSPTSMYPISTGSYTIPAAQPGFQGSYVFAGAGWNSCRRR